ncbi:hypothetical protein HS088_TW12G00539 [Tripterygium wilfordii]|uniref:Uncharacterized protein n=1 Tax=Tripterygium wilfordii TaxID=458696 RepID=A0A7J7CZ24_TRIWF|nr:hypothetical protein HS088_TW12G00539 [Tripterygium wilfordii]
MEGGRETLHAIDKPLGLQIMCQASTWLLDRDLCCEQEQSNAFYQAPLWRNFSRSYQALAFYPRRALCCEKGLTRFTTRTRWRKIWHPTPPMTYASSWLA